MGRRKIFSFALPVLAVLALGTASPAQQKGVDSQTQKIKDDSNKVTTRPNDATRSFDWGKGKTKVRERLPNPYQLNSRRDVLVESIIGVLREQKIVVDDTSSRLKDGVVITQPFVFAKGSVITQNELSHARFGWTPYLFGGAIVALMGLAAFQAKRVLQPRREEDET